MRGALAGRTVAFAMVALLLAACGDDAAEAPAPAPAAPAAAVATPPPAAAPGAVSTPTPLAAPAAAPAPVAVPHAALMGNWAPDMPSCYAGQFMTVGDAGIGGPAVGAGQCVVTQSTADDAAVTMVASCTAPDAGFRTLTLTLRATLIAGAPPATLDVTQPLIANGVTTNTTTTLLRCPEPGVVP